MQTEVNLQDLLFYRQHLAVETRIEPEFSEIGRSFQTSQQLQKRQQSKD
jgi:hypothetical protein